jgi:hypothetical protein
MKANRAFHLIASREGVGPAFLAGDSRHDRIEIVSIDDGEVIMFWELPARDAARLARQLRTDLAGLEAEEFLRKWQHAPG